MRAGWSNSCSSRGGIWGAMVVIVRVFERLNGLWGGTRRNAEAWASHLRLARNFHLDRRDTLQHHNTISWILYRQCAKRVAGKLYLMAISIYIV
jgi:hypothetical protein